MTSPRSSHCDGQRRIDSRSAASMSLIAAIDRQRLCCLVFLPHRSSQPVPVCIHVWRNYFLIRTGGFISKCQPVAHSQHRCLHPPPPSPSCVICHALTARLTCSLHRFPCCSTGCGLSLSCPRPRRPWTCGRATRCNWL